MYDDDLVKISIFIGLIIIFVIVPLMLSTYGHRCSNAGYEGAAHELCVKRLKDGGPVYEENIDKW